MANEVLAALAVKIHGDTRHLDASLQTSGKRILEFGKQAESSSRVFERAFAQNERSVDRLRRAIDPVYASSKKYESAVNTLDKALKQGNITQAAHARMLEQAGAAYLRAGGQAGTATAAMGRFGAMSALNRSRVQNLGFQLQDMAIQFQAGTRASVVFAQQGSQIASIFGPVGAIIGTLAAVGIPLLAFAFANGAEEGKKLEDVMSDLRDLSSGLKAAQDILAMSVQELRDKYGQYALAVQEAARQLAILQAAEAQSRLSENIQDMDEALRDFVQTEQSAFRSGTMLTTAIGNIATQFGVSRQEARALSEALRDVRDAATFDDKVAALQRVGELLEAAGVAGHKIPPPLRQALIDANNLTIATAEMATQMERASAAAAGMTFGIGLDGTEGDLIPPAPNIKKSGGGGGGGGAKPANPIIAQLDALRQALLTQEEAQIASYQRQQETLQQALEQRLITQQEYQALMEGAQRQHSERMAQIDAYRYGDGLQKAGAFFGDMASAFQSGNEKMAAIGKKFAAIEALINAWRAYNQTLADPSLPFFAKFAAAASVLAAGMNAVQAIKGSGGGAASGGGGGVSAAANTPAAPSNSTYFNISLTGGNNYGGEQIRDMIAQINQAIEDGAVIRGIRIA